MLVVVCVFVVCYCYVCWLFGCGFVLVIVIAVILEEQFGRYCCVCLFSFSVCCLLFVVCSVIRVLLWLFGGLLLVSVGVSPLRHFLLGQPDVIPQ